jgi:hypothetical protein
MRSASLTAPKVVKQGLDLGFGNQPLDMGTDGMAIQAEMVTDVQERERTIVVCPDPCEVGLPLPFLFCRTTRAARAKRGEYVQRVAQERPQQHPLASMEHVVPGADLAREQDVGLES